MWFTSGNRIWAILRIHPAVLFSPFLHQEFIYLHCHLLREFGCEIVLGIFFEQVWDFFLDFLAGTICLVFATVWNLNLSFCMVFATFGHVHLPFCMGSTTCGHVHLPFCMVFATFWRVHLPFCMGFPTCGHVHLPFCMVFATFWHVHLPFCMGCSTCEHVHPNIYRCGSLGLDKKRVGGIEGGR